MEEGFAEMVAGMYSSQYSSDGNSNFFMRASRTGTQPYDLNRDCFMGPQGLPVLTKYSFFQPNGKLSDTSATYAGIAFELLCRKLIANSGNGQPEILSCPDVPHLVGARGSEKDYSAFIRSIEGISPGLYMKLYKSKYDNEHFIGLYRSILNEILGGTEQVFGSTETALTQRRTEIESGKMKLRW